MSKNREKVLLLSLLITSLFLSTVCLAASSLGGLQQGSREGQESPASESGPQVQKVMAQLDQVSDQLDGQLETQQGLVRTTLSLNASRREAFIEETLQIQGFLMDQGGSALGGRNVTVSWGTNQTTVVTNAQGKFEADVHFQIGFPAGLAVVEARFEPAGPDSAVYLSSKSSLEIRVDYHPSSIEAEISPRSARRLDSVRVFGRLSSPEGLPLQSKTLVFRLDGTSLGNTTTNSTGGFLFGFTVPVDVSNGTHLVTVSFIALGDRFAPSNTTLPLMVEVSMYMVQGYVTSPDGTTSVPGCWVSIYEPASNATIGSRTDEKGYYRLLTGNGTFVFDLEPPSTSLSYVHYRELNFTVSGDVWKNMTLRYETQTGMRIDRTSLFSGNELTVEGTVKLTNGTLWKYGHVRVFVDAAQYSGAVVLGDGSFVSRIQLPMSVGFGSHTIKVEYFPDEPWVAPSEVIGQVYVYNTGVVIFAALAILTASAFGVYRITRRKQAAALVPSTLPEAVAVEEPPSALREPVAAESFCSDERLTSTIEAECDHASKVRKCYQLARGLIDQKLGEQPRENETHWEYLRRVETTLPTVKHSLKRLVELFELAEYSPHPIGSAESQEATDILLKLRKDIGQSYVESGQEYSV